MSLKKGVHFKVSVLSWKDIWSLFSVPNMELLKLQEFPECLIVIGTAFVRMRQLLVHP